MSEMANDNSSLANEPVGAATEPAPLMFPAWANYLLPVALVFVLGGATYVPAYFSIAMTDTALNTKYAPIQPVPYSHALHVGELGMDCLYCHTTVDKAAHAAIPPTQTCMNCHTKILPSSDKLKPVRDSYASGMPIEWKKVHDLPDHAYFNHAVHVNKGVGCVSCHGRVDQMEVVQQAEPLSMGWCLDCHRAPEKHLRPIDQVTNMAYVPDKPQEEIGKELKAKYNIHDANYMQSCSLCHR